MDVEVDPVPLIGIAFIIGGVVALLTGHIPGALIAFGVAAIALGFGGEGEVSGMGIVVSGSVGLVLIVVGAFLYYIMGGL